MFDTPTSPISSQTRVSRVRESASSSNNQPPARYRPITDNDLSSLRKTPPSPKITRPSCMPLSNSSAVPPAVHSIHNNQVILSPRIKQFPSPSKENHEHRRTSSRENSAISEKFSPVLNNNSNSKQRQNISNNSPQRQLTFLNSPQRNVPSLSSPQRQVSSLNSPQRKVPSLNSPQRQFSSINSSQRQVPSLNSPLRQVSSINSSQIQDPSLNTLQRQVSSNLNSKKNIILHRQNSNPSKILSNTSSILQNTTNSLPRPNYGKDRRSNMNNNANNDGYLSSPRHAG